MHLRPLLLGALSRVLIDDTVAEEVFPPGEKRHIFPGPAPIRSRGCGRPLSLPVGAPLNMILPVPEDEMLFNKFREYYLYLPKKFNNTEPLPLTISFHGFYDEAIDQEKTDKLMAMSIQTGGSFIAVHPQGMMDTGTRTPQVRCLFLSGLSGSGWPVRSEFAFSLFVLSRCPIRSARGTVAGLLGPSRPQARTGQL